MEIEIVPVLADNYAYLLAIGGNSAVVVDPSEPGPVLAALRKRGWRLTHILNTHHHGDHVGGNRDLKQVTGCRIIASEYDFSRGRVPDCDEGIGDGAVLELGALRAQALHVPGHTLGHTAYWFAAQNAVFTGDTLFRCGCGRLFEGTAEQMWRSLRRLRDLPPETRVHPGHEYALKNIAFARRLEPDSVLLRATEERLKALRGRSEPCVPVVMEDERCLNPFLRADDPALQAAARLPADPVAAFAELRARKDRF